MKASADSGRTERRIRLVYIAAGAADMYCGSCLQDNTLALALQRLGQDVTLLPTYTPLRTDEPSAAVDRLFFGGINVFLQQKLSIFRQTPWILDRLLDRPWFLALASRLSSATDPGSLGDLTLSILKAEDGHQSKELEKLTDWLEKEQAPDLIHLTNSLLSGWAAPLKRRLGVPVLCSLQGEDLFLQGLSQSHREQTLHLISEKSQAIDGFVSHSHFYADYMANYLKLDRSRIHVVPLSINLEGHHIRKVETNPEEFVVGYLARVCPEKGFHNLVDAFCRLARQRGQENLRLEVAGYLSLRDKSYFQEQSEKIRERGLAGNFRYWGEVQREKKIEFLRQISVLSVPTVYREPKGLYVLEALANATPVVQPRHGAFPELIEATGGGLLYDPSSQEELVDCLDRLIRDPDKRKELGETGATRVRSLFGATKVAEQMLEIYQNYVG